MRKAVAFFSLIVICVSSYCCIGNKAETDDTQHLLSSEEKRHGLYHYHQRTKFSNEKAKKLFEKAKNLSEKGDFIRAKKLFLESLKIEPENAMVLTCLGNLAYASGNFNDAVGYYNRSHIVSDSIHLNAGVHLGRSYYLNGEYDKCIIISKYTLAQTTDEKTYYMAYYNMTKAQIKQGNCEAAEKSFKKAKPVIHQFSSFKTRIHALEHELSSCKNQ